MESVEVAEEALLDVSEDIGDNLRATRICDSWTLLEHDQDKEGEPAELTLKTDVIDLASLARSSLNKCEPIDALSEDTTESDIETIDEIPHEFECSVDSVSGLDTDAENLRGCGGDHQRWTSAMDNEEIEMINSFLDSTLCSDLSPVELPHEYPKIAKGRTYQHMPNTHLNVLLTSVLMVVLSMALGLGIGHFMGFSERLELQEQYADAREGKLEELADSLVTCITGEEGMGGDDQDLEEKVIRQLSRENMDLKEELDLLKKMHGGQAVSYELATILRVRINDLLLANLKLEKEVAQLRKSHDVQSTLQHDMVEESHQLKIAVGKPGYDRSSSFEMMNFLQQRESEELRSQVGKIHYGGLQSIPKLSQHDTESVDEQSNDASDYKIASEHAGKPIMETLRRHDNVLIPNEAKGVDAEVSHLDKMLSKKNAANILSNDEQMSTTTSRRHLTKELEMSTPEEFAKEEPETDAVGKVAEFINSGTAYSVSDESKKNIGVNETEESASKGANSSKSHTENASKCFNEEKKLSDYMKGFSKLITESTSELWDVVKNSESPQQVLNMFDSFKHSTTVTISELWNSGNWKQKVWDYSEALDKKLGSIVSTIPEKSRNTMIMAQQAKDKLKKTFLENVEKGHTLLRKQLNEDPADWIKRHVRELEKRIEDLLQNWDLDSLFGNAETFTRDEKYKAFDDGDDISGFDKKPEQSQLRKKAFKPHKKLIREMAKNLDKYDKLNQKEQKKMAKMSKKFNQKKKIHNNRQMTSLNYDDQSRSGNNDWVFDRAKSREKSRQERLIDCL